VSYGERRPAFLSERSYFDSAEAVWIDPEAEAIPFGEEPVSIDMHGIAEEIEERRQRDAARRPRLANVPDEPASALRWERLSEVEMRSVVFLDKPLLQADALHLVAGRKGMGKGTLLSEIAARVTRGELGGKRNVVWIGSEDSAAIDIRPRILAAEGIDARVLVVTEGWVQLPRDLEEIRQAIARLGEVGMLVIDPIGNHITGKNSNADTDIRDAIAPLNAVADEHGCMVFGVRHLSEKECGRGALAAILGASAWVHVPRAVLVVARDDVDAQLSHVQCIAGNRLPPDTPGRMFRIEGVRLPGLENEVTRAVWLGDSSKDVETILAATGNGKKPSRSGEARELILNILENEGEQESDALDARVARETGLAAKTVRNTRSELANEGLVKSHPEKDEYGAVLRWIVSRTQAPRELPTGTNDQDPDDEPPSEELLPF
jgi:DNA repair protein RadA/Sms